MRALLLLSVLIGCGTPTITPPPPPEEIPDAGTEEPPKPCATGCFMVTSCQPGTEFGACGGGAGACVTCGAGQLCRNQQCVPTTTVGIRWTATVPTTHECTHAARVSAGDLAQLKAQYASCTFDPIYDVFYCSGGQPGPECTWDSTKARQCWCDWFNTPRP